MYVEIIILLDKTINYIIIIISTLDEFKIIKSIFVTSLFLIKVKHDKSDFNNFTINSTNLGKRNNVSLKNCYSLHMNEILRSVLHALMYSSATITPTIIDSWFNFSWSMAFWGIYERDKDP